MDSANRGDIRVDAYDIFANRETSVMVYETVYLHRVANDNDMVIFMVDVVYSDSNIYNLLVTKSSVTVDVEGTLDLELLSHFHALYLPLFLSLSLSLSLSR